METTYKEVITIPKIRSKKKRKDYYKVFYRAKTKDPVKVWNFLDNLINDIGNPFIRKRTGRPPKFKDLRIYTKICILIGYFDYTLDEVAGILPLLVNSSLDRSNIDRWFQKMDISYIQKASEYLNEKLDNIFDYGEYIVDATKYTTNEYQEVFHKGQTTFELVMVGLHIIVNYFFKEGFISIVKFHVSDGWSHESPVFREKLLPKTKLKPNRRMHGDKGFAAEDTFEMLFEKELIPNICQKESAKGGFCTRKAKKLYNNNLRKQIRGLVETVFGGMQTETDNRVRFKLDKTRKLYVGIRALTHQIRTYFRALVYKSLNYLMSFATTSKLSLKKHNFNIFFDPNLLKRGAYFGTDFNNHNLYWNNPSYWFVRLNHLKKTENP